MKVISVRRGTLGEIKAEVSRKKFRELKRVMKVAEKVGALVYFIPEYEFPAAAGIPRYHIVSEKYMTKYFIVWLRIGNTSWFQIIPRRKNTAGVLIENGML